MKRSKTAFTLIEMLVVIAIIGIIASLVLGLGSLASRKKQDAVASATINKLVAMIDNYQSKLGYYPPDNTNNLAIAPTPAAYENSTTENQLLYELTGATQQPPANGVNNFLAFDGTNLLSSTLVSIFGRGGIANSSPDEPHNFYYPLPKPTDYSLFGSTGLKVLTVPLPLPGNSSKQPNYVHFDSSSAYRHNPGSYDVWVTFDGGSSGTNSITITNGNWH